MPIPFVQLLSSTATQINWAVNIYVYYIIYLYIYVYLITLETLLVSIMNMVTRRTFITQVIGMLQYLETFQASLHGSVTSVAKFYYSAQDKLHLII